MAPAFLLVLRIRYIRRIFYAGGMRFFYVLFMIGNDSFIYILVIGFFISDPRLRAAPFARDGIGGRHLMWIVPVR